MASNTYVALATQTLGSAAASVTFSSIPQGYTDLVIVAQTRTTNATSSRFQMNFNGDTGSNYSYTRLNGDGTSATSDRISNFGISDVGYYPASSTGRYAQSIIQVQNYANATTYKTSLTRFADAGAITQAIVGLWRGSTGSATQAITSISLAFAAGNIDVGSTFTLYGIAAASVGAKATGGAIYQDASYFYHVFTGSGTFAPTQSISADVLCVAGGGGAGYYGGGGGGAGGIQYATAQSLTATNYAITIGAGGASKSGSAAGNGATGSDSSFASSVIAKGGGYGAGSNGGSVSGGNGGSGGGGGGTGGSGAGGSAVAGTGGTHYGNAGGANGSFAGSGGGSGAAGTTAGAGGNGTSVFSSWGVVTGTGQNVSGTYYYAGGGGSNNGTAGGYGGGGAWLNSGTANTGGGGGADQNGGGGGSGIVIVRYAK